MSDNEYSRHMALMDLTVARITNERDEALALAREALESGKRTEALLTRCLHNALNCLERVGPYLNPEIAAQVADVRNALAAIGEGGA